MLLNSAPLWLHSVVNIMGTPSSCLAFLRASSTDKVHASTHQTRGGVSNMRAEILRLVLSEASTLPHKFANIRPRDHANVMLPLLSRGIM